jgi:sterol desaturase/sphingolipid hydroxylase (fatty acid hydroxylase superfamily)
MIENPVSPGYSTPNILRYAAYPVLYLGVLAVWAFLWKGLGWQGDVALMTVYWLFFFVLLGLERFFPFEAAWNRNDGQLGNDIAWSIIAITINSAATVFLLWLLGLAIGHFEPLVSLNIWPTGWPVPVQIILGILVWDLGNHLAHRAGHKIPFLWRFHAVHHSAARLSVINTGRFHPLDTFKSVAIGAPLPILLGAPADISLWYAAANVFSGILTHCNVNLHCGPLNYIMSTPNLHRWHHSRRQEETDSNFGEMTIIWDLLFGSYCNPDRRPPRDVGIDVPVSARFWRQFIQPLTPQGHHAEGDQIPALPGGEAGA